MRKDGSLINAHLEVTKHEDKGKSSFVGTLTRIEAESLESFIDSHAKVLLSLDVPVIAIGIDGVIYFANKTAEDSFGFSSNTLKGNNVNILMTAAHAKKHNGYIENYLKTGRAKILGKGRVVNVQCKNGNVRQCHLTLTERKKDSHRFFIGILAVLY